MVVSRRGLEEPDGEDNSMQLKTFRVQKFRNIEDSGGVELLDALTTPLLRSFLNCVSEVDA